MRDSSPLNRQELCSQLQRPPRLPPDGRPTGFSGRRLDPRTRRRVVPPPLHSRTARIRPQCPTGRQEHVETLRFRFERRTCALDVTCGRVPPLLRDGAPPRTSPRCARQVVADSGYLERHACAGLRRAAAPGAPSAVPLTDLARRGREVRPRPPGSVKRQVRNVQPLTKKLTRRGWKSSLPARKSRPLSSGYV